MKRLSFLVRARDEEDHIGYALQSIFDLFGSATPVCVVDNESQDDTLAVVRMFSRRFHDIETIRIRRSDYTPGAALNLGMTKLSDRGSDFVCILSAHCEMRDASREIVERKFQDSSTFAVMGKQIPIRRGKRITPRYIWANFQVEQDVINPHESPRLEERRPFFHNAFSFVRTEHWLDYKFDEDLSGKEDRYWAQEHILRGRRFVITPDLTCRHFWTPKGATWAD
jgi:glycosyltransferase involved in cell wall biosynthesis